MFLLPRIELLVCVRLKIGDSWNGRSKFEALLVTPLSLRSVEVDTA